MSASIDDTMQSTSHGALALAETSTPFAALLGEPAASQSSQAPRIGKYLLGDSLGSGGMGEVFLATDTQLGRKVAIKLLRLRNQGDPLERARLLREAQALAAIDDANVVGVYECGLHGDQLFIAMALVEGCTLRDWQDEALRDWRDVLRHYVAAGHGLTAIHAAGLVHRDFKPQNVLVGAQGRVKITDFGLAVKPGQRAPQAPAAAVRARLLSLLATQLTASATVLGTPLYISPEQLAAQPLDARSDQFSFCVALYEALYGGHPYAEPDPTTEGRAATDPGSRGAVGRGPSGTPSMISLVTGLIEGPLRRPRRLVIPRRIYAAIERGLARDPAARWPSMPALLAALTRDPLRKYGPWAAVAGVSAMIGAAVLIPEVVSQCKDIEADFRDAWTPASAAAIQQAFRATGSPHAERASQLVTQTLADYRAQWLAARRDNCDATHDRAAQDAEVHRRRDTCLDHARDTLAAMTLQLGHADAATVETVSDALALLPALEQCSPAFQRQQTCLDGIDDPALRARLDHVRGLEVAGKFADADAAVDVILGEPLPPRLAAEAQLLRGRVLADLRRGEEAAAAFTAAFDLAEGAGCDTLGFAAATGHTKLVALHHELPADTGLVWSAVARSKFGRFPASPRLEAELHSDLGLLLQHRDDLAGPRTEHLARARSEHDAALILREQIAGDRPTPELAISNLNLGALEATGDRHELGLDRLHRALDLYTDVYGPDHPTLWKPYRNLGNALLRLERTAEARVALERGIALVEAGLGTGHAALGPLQYALATSYVDDDPARALALATVALATYVREIPDGDPQRVDPLVLLGQIHTDRSEPGLALPHRQEALRRLGRAEPEDRASAHLDLAMTLHELARPQEALAHLQLADAVLGERGPTTGSYTELSADILALRAEVLRSASAT